jgi:cysteine desulfuration protein SufE
MTLGQQEEHFIQRLLLVPDPQERLSVLVARGGKSSGLEPVDKIEVNRIHGCASAVWVVGAWEDGKCRFRSDADSPLVKGLVHFLCELYSGVEPREIVEHVSDPWIQLGLASSLSLTRQHGLSQVRAALQTYARACLLPETTKPVG